MATDRTTHLALAALFDHLQLVCTLGDSGDEYMSTPCTAVHMPVRPRRLHDFVVILGERTR